MLTTRGYKMYIFGKFANAKANSNIYITIHSISLKTFNINNTPSEYHTYHPVLQILYHTLTEAYNSHVQ